MKIPPTPHGVDDATFRKAFASLCEADQLVLSISAEKGYKPTVEEIPDEADTELEIEALMAG